VAAPATPERAAGAGTAAAATPARPPATPLRCRRQATLPPCLPLPFAASPGSPWEGAAARLPAALARGSGRAQAGSTRSATPQAAHLQ